MKNILSIDGWYFRVFSKLANLVLLNLIFIISMIPVFTIGIALIALICTLQELRQDGTISAVKIYSMYFRNNMAKGMSLLAIEVIGLSVPSVFIYISLKYVPLLSTLLMIIFSFLLLLLIIFPFIYGLNDLLVKEAIKQTIIFVTLRISYAIAIFIIPVVIIFFSLKYSIIFIFLIGIAVIGYMQLSILNRGGF